jgi:hypothetical protein
MFLCSFLAKLLAQRNVLATNQNLSLAELLTPMFTRVQTPCLLNVPKNQTIMLPKLPSSPELDIWIFVFMQLCGHFSYSAHHCHSHSTFLKLLAPLLFYNLSLANLILEPKITPHRLSISSFRLLPPEVS